MSYLLKEELNIATDNIHCDACLWLNNEHLRDVVRGMAFTDIKAILTARNEGWNILKGTKFIHQLNADSLGEFYTFKARPEIHKICIKYDIYNYI